MSANLEANKFDQISEQMDSIQEYGEMENMKMGRAVVVIVENDRSAGARTLMDQQCKNSSNLVTTQIMIVMTMWHVAMKIPADEEGWISDPSD